MLIRTTTIYLLFFILFGKLALANKRPIYGVRLSDDDTLEKLANIPEIKTLIQICKNYRKERKLSEDDLPLPECLLKGTKDKVIQPPSKAVFAKIKTAFIDKLKEEGYSPDEIASLAILKLETGAKDPALSKLEDYYSKRLEESLYGKYKKGSKRRVVDHAKFHELYKTQVSKNIIEGISEYCIEAEPKKGFLLSSNQANRQKRRKENLKNLANFEEDSPIAYKEWSLCLVNIQHICHGTSSSDEKGKLINNYESLTKESDGNALIKVRGKVVSIDKKDLEFSKKRACTLTRYIKDSRQTLLKVTQIQDLFKKVVEDDAGTGFDIKELELEEYREEDEKTKSLDELTSLTSDEFLNKSGFSEESKRVVKDFKTNCLKNMTVEGCEKYFGRDLEKAEKLASEFALRTKVLMDKISDMKGNNDKLTTYLRQEGFSEKEIKAAIQDKEIFKKIQKRYANEREYLILRMSEELRKKTLSGKSKEQIDFKKPETLRKIEEINTALSQRTEEYKQLIHFNNIVSGYISLSGEFEKDEKDKGQINVASIYREIKGSAYSKKEKGEESAQNEININRLEDIEEKLKSQGYQEGPSKEKIRPIDVKMLNATILTYREGKIVPEKEGAVDIEEVQ